MPIGTKSKLSLHDGNPVTDASFYRGIIGALQYVTLTRPDVAYAVNQTCLCMHTPRYVHWNIIKRILRYLRGTLDQGIHISATPSTQLTAYSDADWVIQVPTKQQYADIMTKQLPSKLFEEFKSSLCAKIPEVEAPTELPAT
nr:uncharacterized mitochondrial protein AtMg00810-like [Setaria viridis]